MCVTHVRISRIFVNDIVPNFVKMSSYETFTQVDFCPARSAGFLNPLTRKIVFVRPACVRASVPHFLIVILQLFTSYLEIDEIVAFPIRSALQVCGPLLI